MENAQQGESGNGHGHLVGTKGNHDHDERGEHDPGRISRMYERHEDQTEGESGHGFEAHEETPPLHGNADPAQVGVKTVKDGDVTEAEERDEIKGDEFKRKKLLPLRMVQWPAFPVQRSPRSPAQSSLTKSMIFRARSV